MKKISCSFYILLCITSTVYGQVSTGKVQSLVAAENYFAGIVKEKGLDEAFLKVGDDNTLLFRPDPVKVKTYFKNNPQNKASLTWEPTYARVSRSGDWGFTTGPYVFKDSEESDEIVYGQYVSVWQTDKKGVWKLALNAGISHKKPVAMPKLDFKDPSSSKFFRQWSDSRLKQREDMVFTTDVLFSKTLEKYKNLAYNEFIGDDARLLFPGLLPIVGKSNIREFLRARELKITTQPVKADRAFGGDLAYTYGTADIIKDGGVKKYNYVRIWELQEAYKWYVILEILTEDAG